MSHFSGTFRCVIALFFFSFLSLAQQSASAMSTDCAPHQVLRLPADEQSMAIAVPGRSGWTLGLQSSGPGLLILEYESSTAVERIDEGSLTVTPCTTSGAKMVVSQGRYVTIALTDAMLHSLQMEFQGKVPTSLVGHFIPARTETRRLFLTTATEPLDIWRTDLLDTVDGALLVSLFELRDPWAFDSNQRVAADLAVVADGKLVETVEGWRYTAEMDVTLRLSALAGLGGRSANVDDDPNPPDDEVDPYPIGLTGGGGSRSANVDDDPNPPDDEVDPYPIGLTGGGGSRSANVDDDPNPPDDEVDPYPIGLTGGGGSRSANLDDDPNPPDDEVDPYPIGLTGGRGSRSAKVDDDPNPPDDEVDPYPIGLTGGRGSRSAKVDDDPNPPDDEVDPYPIGLTGGRGSRFANVDDDPNPPDDEVDPYPIGLTTGLQVAEHRLIVQLNSAGVLTVDEETQALLGWLVETLWPERGAVVTSGTTLRWVENK